MTLTLQRPPARYDVGHEGRRNLALEQADAQSWKHTGDVDHPHALTVRSRSVSPFKTFTADDATPSVALGKNFKTANANATTITAFDDGVDGQEIEVHIRDANTTVDFTGTTLQGNAGADWSPANGDFMRCKFDGTNWYCSVHDATA